MKRGASDSAAVGEANSPFDTVIEWLMAALLLFMPLAFGAVEPWSEMVCVVIASAMAVGLALKSIAQRRAALAWHGSYVPIGLLGMLVFSQQLPLPRGMVEAVSPGTAAVKVNLLSDLPDAERALGWMTPSLYPHATRHGLRSLFVVAVVFFAALSICRRPAAVKRLLGAVAIIGGGVAVLALAQILSGTGKIYWRVPVEFKEVANSGTFVNHSHFGQFMNLSIGAALGLLLVELRKGFRGVSLALPSVVERLGSPALRVVWYLAGIIVIGTATVFLSLTRGGMIALLAAGGFTTMVLAVRRGLRDWRWLVAVIIAMLSFVAVLHVGFEAVYDRLGSLCREDMRGGRWQTVKDTLAGWAAFPSVGSGLGTHEVVHPLFSGSATAGLATHAENEYAQIAEETGLLGVCALAVFLFMVWRSYIRCVRPGGPAIRVAALGLGLGLLAVMIQSLTDFGQHILANACLAAIFAALILGLDSMGHARPPRQSGRQTKRRVRILAAVALAFVLGVCAWAIVSANRARLGESHWRQALRIEKELNASGWQGGNEQYASLIAHAQAAAGYQPDDVKYRYWLNVYRWRSVSRVTDPQTCQIVVTPDILRHTRRIVDDLHRARRSCPTFGPVYCLAGQLEKFALNEPRGAGHIRTACALAPCDAAACYAAGLLDATEGRLDDSLARFRQCLAIDGDFHESITNAYLHLLNRPGLALVAAGDNFSRLLYLARALENGDDQEPSAAHARSGALRLLKRKCDAPDADAEVLAAMAGLCRRNGDHPAALAYLRRALARDGARVEWRLEMALCLAENGQVKAAGREARACLRLRPEMKAAKQLIAELKILPQGLQDGRTPFPPVR